MSGNRTKILAAFCNLSPSRRQKEPEVGTKNGNNDGGGYETASPGFTAGYAVDDPAVIARKLTLNVGSNQGTEFRFEVLNFSLCLQPGGGKLP